MFEEFVFSWKSATASFIGLSKFDIFLFFDMINNFGFRISVDTEKNPIK